MLASWQLAVEMIKGLFGTLEEIRLPKFKEHRNTVSCLAFSTDGQFLASGDLDGVLQICDHSGNQKQKLDIEYGSSSADAESELEWVKWHPREHLVLAGSADHNAYTWDADKDTLFQIFSGHGESVTCGDFTPDGKVVCTGSADGTLRIWDSVSGTSI
ncbi:hypothetical protein OROHE_004697 [Orobanche hederae]